MNTCSNFGRDFVKGAVLSFWKTLYCMIATIFWQQLCSQNMTCPASWCKPFLTFLLYINIIY
jgi:hypothetical protein